MASFIFQHRINNIVHGTSSGRRAVFEPHRYSKVICKPCSRVFLCLLQRSDMHLVAFGVRVVMFLSVREHFCQCCPVFPQKILNLKMNLRRTLSFSSLIIGFSFKIFCGNLGWQQLAVL